MPNHTEKGTCKNCGHKIYYQFNTWHHHTRAYKPHSFPYTTLKCYAPGNNPYGSSTDLNGTQRTACLCDKPEPLKIHHIKIEDASPELKSILNGGKRT